MSELDGKIMRISGYDYFTPDAKNYKKFEYQNCRVCNTPFTISGIKDGATQIAEARAGMKHKHVTFTCENTGKPWHNQAYRLMKEIEKTSSRTLTNLLTEELNEVIKKKKSTKKVNPPSFFDS